MRKINVNAKNSKKIDGKLFITRWKMVALSSVLSSFIVRGNTIEYPGLGKMYQYDGPYSRV